MAARTKNGETPLHWAARYNQNPVIPIALLDSGADLRTQTPRGETALDCANPICLRPRPLRSVGLANTVLAL